MPRREDHEVRKGHVGHWIKKKIKIKFPKVESERKNFGKYLYRILMQWYWPWATKLF